MLCIKLEYRIYRCRIYGMLQPNPVSQKSSCTG